MGKLPKNCCNSGEIKPSNIVLDNIKPPKLKLQSFDGCNPVEWIFQADQYFSHYSNDALNRLIRIYCYMMGEALGWYQWMNNNHLLTTWDENVLQLLLEK
jgi:hypothetical protein